MTAGTRLVQDQGRQNPGKDIGDGLMQSQGKVAGRAEKELEGLGVDLIKTHYMCV